MNSINPINNLQESKIRISAKVVGVPFSVGKGFDALSFQNSSFAFGFDPLIMVDHYVMQTPTFGAHPHAGLSAVSVLFEDSVGKFHNTDSLGNDLDLEPGDLYWLKAGSGAVHDERPREGAKIHGLQMFVNIPNQQKNAQPDSLLVRANNMPIIQDKGYKVRLVLGDYLNRAVANSPSIPMTILDGKLNSESEFQFELRAGFNAWLYSVSGSISVKIAESKHVLQKGESIAIENSGAQDTIRLLNQDSQKAHFVIVSAAPLKESFVQQGPLVAADNKAMSIVIAKEKAGLFGNIK